jgi:replicative DNA helicase
VDDLRQGRLDDASRAAVGAVAVRLRDQGPRFDVMPPEGFEGLTALLRAHPIDVLIVDPIQALLAGRPDPDAALASMIRQLKALALAHHLCIMAVSHLPHWTPRPDPRPVLEDLGAMGAIQESADVVLALFREEMYTPDHGVEGATELLVRKHRNGSLGYLDLYFYKQWLRFEDMLDPDR